MDCSSLVRAIQQLARIDADGRLDDLLCDLSRSTRGPARDLDRFPQWSYDVERFGRLASRLLGVPPTTAREAAIEALLPETRLGMTLRIIDEHDARAEEAALRAQAQEKLAKDRRRLRRA